MQLLRRIMPIGGQYPYDFHQEQKSNKTFARYFDLEVSHRFFCSGREAFRWILSQTKITPDPLLMPDYGCWSALAPVLEKEKIPFELYSVDKNFKPVCVPEQLKKAGALSLVKYFGLVDHSAFAAFAKEINPDITIILDNVPALYDLRGAGKASPWADWQYYSLRKWIAVPDGGLAVSMRGPVEQEDDIALAPYPYEAPWQEAAQMKFDYLFRDKTMNETHAARFWDLYKTAESMIKEQSGGISALSARLIDTFPLADFAKIRRKNFLTLQKNWPSDASEIKPCFTALGPEDVPQYFVIAMPEKIRDSLQQYLFDQEIYPPVHWPEWNGYGAPLARTLLSLPIDQRYTGDDMHRVLGAIQKFAAGQGA